VPVESITSFALASGLEIKDARIRALAEGGYPERAEPALLVR